MNKLEKKYKKILDLKRKNRKINLNIEDLKRFDYFINSANYYNLYPFEEVIHYKKLFRKKFKKILLVNLDFNDFIQSFFFRNEIIKYCNLNKLNLDVVSAYHYDGIEKELNHLINDQTVKYGQEWLFPIDNNKWKKNLEDCLKKNKYDLLIFNGINYYFYYFIKNFIGLRAKIVIYDPHLLVGKNDIRDIDKIKSQYFKNKDITIIADETPHEYRRLGIKWFNNFISHKYSLPSYIKNYYKVNSIKRLSRIFMGGDSSRNYKGLYSLAKKYPKITFLVCTSRNLDYTLDNLYIYNRLPYYKYLELINTTDMSLILLQKDTYRSGIINIVISFLLSKPCLITIHRNSRKYIKTDYNGYLVSSIKQAEKIIRDLIEPKKFKQITENASNTFNKEHKLENLVEKIFSLI